MITIELPWPDKRLSPNSRNRWAKIKATKWARHDAFYVTREAKNDVIEWYSGGLPYRILAQYTFYPPDRRQRDRDNFSAMMKAYQDGVCDALGIDDNCFEMEKPIWGEVTPGGKVVLRLEEMP